MGWRLVSQPWSRVTASTSYWTKLNILDKILLCISWRSMDWIPENCWGLLRCKSLSGMYRSSRTGNKRHRQNISCSCSYSQWRSMSRHSILWQVFGFHCPGETVQGKNHVTSQVKNIAGQDVYHKQPAFPVDVGYWATQRWFQFSPNLQGKDGQV